MSLIINMVLKLLKNNDRVPLQPKRVYNFMSNVTSNFTCSIENTFNNYTNFIKPICFNIIQCQMYSQSIV